LGKQINGIDVYEVQCGHCGVTHEGRLFHPAVWLGRARYCSSCPILKLIGDTEDKGPVECSCGGSLDSMVLVCPHCCLPISDSEKQIAVQFYLVQPAQDEDNPTSVEIDKWYDARREEGFLTGNTLYIQLREVVSFDEESNSWKTYNCFDL
jgi:hypothetical protein